MCWLWLSRKKQLPLNFLEAGPSLSWFQFLFPAMARKTFQPTAPLVLVLILFVCPGSSFFFQQTLILSKGVRQESTSQFRCKYICRWRCAAQDGQELVKESDADVPAPLLASARIMTYNVLSSSLCEPEYHVKCKPEDLDEKTRLRRVMKKLDSAKAE